MRNHDVKNINLKVIGVDFFNNDDHKGMYISWSSDIGFGEYCIYFDKNENIFGDSECMDSNEDKEFIKELLNKLNDYILKNIQVVG